jgi:hypothetical protein
LTQRRRSLRAQHADLFSDDIFPSAQEPMCSLRDASTTPVRLKAMPRNQAQAQSRVGCQLLEVERVQLAKQVDELEQQPADTTSVHATLCRDGARRGGDMSVRGARPAEKIASIVSSSFWAAAPRRNNRWPHCSRLRTGSTHSASGNTRSVLPKMKLTSRYSPSDGPRPQGYRYSARAPAEDPCSHQRVHDRGSGRP